MWQKCPICNGTGNNNSLVENIFSNVCTTCNGKGIISELTGLPPKGIETFASPKYRNKNGSAVVETCSHRRIEEIQDGQIEMCKDCGKTWGR